MIASKQKQSREANIAARRESPELQAFLSDYHYVPGRTVLAARLYGRFRERYPQLEWTKRAFLSALPDKFPRGCIRKHYYVGNIVSVRASNVTQADRDAEDRHLIAWRGCLVPHDRPRRPAVPPSELTNSLPRFLASECVAWKGELIPFGEFYTRFVRHFDLHCTRHALSKELQRLGVAVAVLPRDMRTHVGNLKWGDEPVTPATAAWFRKGRYLLRERGTVCKANDTVCQ